MIVCNIQLQNKKDSFIKATIDDKGNIYVATGMLGVVQKFNKNGDFIKSILIKDDIDMIKNERDGIHVYAGKFDYTDYHITEKKIIEKEINDLEKKVNLLNNELLKSEVYMDQLKSKDILLQIESLNKLIDKKYIDLESIEDCGN